MKIRYIFLIFILLGTFFIDNSFAGSFKTEPIDFSDYYNNCIKTKNYEECNFQISIGESIVEGCEKTLAKNSYCYDLIRRISLTYEPSILHYIFKAWSPERIYLLALINDHPANNYNDELSTDSGILANILIEFLGPPPEDPEENTPSLETVRYNSYQKALNAMWNVCPKSSKTDWLLCEVPDLDNPESKQKTCPTPKLYFNNCGEPENDGRFSCKTFNHNGYLPEWSSEHKEEYFCYIKNIFKNCTNKETFNIYQAMPKEALKEFIFYYQCGHYPFDLWIHDTLRFENLIFESLIFNKKRQTAIGFFTESLGGNGSGASYPLFIPEKGLPMFMWVFDNAINFLPDGNIYGNNQKIKIHYSYFEKSINGYPIYQLEITEEAE